ncbi:molybdate ABC transporter substrate-binding protein [Xanthomonas translucens]|uniref:molybdate ABC transporter substrate-binding protein n=4 Tax=Xanthomonas campestris pv. translucens TaxID=343 RepID=UPI0006419646|nr:molybdate ABC transporter substrate-binding protein [Xanthomonas translucens]AKK68674.1 molybdenum ABC transporter substrate-binding protein [Xanthomonas translucens pv. undulosa]AVY65820.1 molybdenum ABC transporter substrate-binding protein [Xanthomonas translucens pv. undulosa]MCT8269444.1 molybdate ABC transporter substrate-binding protein [Xanthomonas translucens pv. undulosa]QEN94560.1 molybdate ABC transporter substrate-binding protein [Xanthomonas translucens pv. undulosa]QEO27402.1
MSRSLRRLLCLLSLAVAMAVPPALAQTPLTVFAAASLKESLDEAAAAYQQSSGTPLQVSYAASSALARQVEQGAPADVFFSADLEWMDYLQQRQLVDPAQRRNLLGNTLVLVAPLSSAAKVDLRKPGTLAAALGAQGRLAVGQTTSVPAGKYARAALQTLRQWDGVQACLAESDSVRAALMLVARGEAPLGIVYGSDAKAEPKVRVVAVFPADSHAPIVYPVAALRASTHPAATDFVRWLGTPPAQAIFQRHGFSLAH